jgi:hypothetical protein
MGPWDTRRPSTGSNCEGRSSLLTRAAEPRTIFAELGPLSIKWERPFYRRAARSERYKLEIDERTRAQLRALGCVE